MTERSEMEDDSVPLTILNTAQADGTRAVRTGFVENMSLEKGDEHQFKAKPAMRQIQRDNSSTRHKIPRKPLPPDSPYSRGNSPRNSAFSTQMPIFANSPSQKKPHPPSQTVDTTTKQTSLLSNDSIKSVSLKTDADTHQHLSLPIMTKNTQATSRPSPSKNGYSVLVGAQATNDPFMDESNTTFPLRPKSFEGRPFYTKKRWIIITCLVLVLIVVAIRVGVAFSNGFDIVRGSQSPGR